MSARALGGLLLRPALGVTLAIMLTLTAVMLYMKHAIDDPSVRAHVIFVIMLNVLTFGWLVSLGGFLGKVTMELETVRIARTVPGLRRRINHSILLLVPVVATLGLLFLGATVPEHFVTVHPASQWFLNSFLFSLGLGLGSSWLLFTVLGAILLKLGLVLDSMRNDPAAFSIVALGGTLFFLTLRYWQFLAPIEPGKGHRLLRIYEACVGFLSWLVMPASGASRHRRAASWRDVPDWKHQARGVSMAKLVRAGIYERLGPRHGMNWGCLAMSLGAVYAIFGLMLFSMSRRYPELGFSGFVAQVFAGQRLDVAHYLFAAIFGGVAYVSAVMHDASPSTAVWYPISRDLRLRAVFMSHLRQNAAYGGAHLLVVLGLIWSVSRFAGTDPSLTLVGAFLMPILVAFALAPIPQGIFHRGPDDFRGKTVPLKQLLGGVLGGLFCLLCTYWTVHWPLRSLHGYLSPFTRATLFVGMGLAIYLGYYVRMKHHFLRADLSRRSS